MDEDNKIEELTEEDNLIENGNEYVIINSTGSWQIDGRNVKGIDIMEQDDVYHVIVNFETGGEIIVHADYEQYESLEEAEMRRAEILLELEKKVGLLAR